MVHIPSPVTDRKPAVPSARRIPRPGTMVVITILAIVYLVGIGFRFAFAGISISPRRNEPRFPTH